jgi:O-methyltransferase domain
LTAKPKEIDRDLERSSVMERSTSEVAGAIQLLRLTESLILHQALYAAAVLGVADLLKEGPRPVTELAKLSQVNEDALFRTLRYLSGHDVFCEIAPRQFSNSELSKWLRSDVPQSIRAIVIFRGSQYFFKPFEEFLHTVRTGQPSSVKALGMPGFEYLSCHPGEARIFDDAMTALSSLSASVIATTYDFGQWGSLMDIGGGQGLLLAEILRVHKDLRGVLTDQEYVIDRARTSSMPLMQFGDRVQFQCADIFREVPGGCRACLMKNIIHDWDDGCASRILRNCRDSIPQDGVLLLVEYCLDEINSSFMAQAADLIMMTVTGGRERTFPEYRNLLSGTHFQISRAIPVSGHIQIIEAFPT